VTDYTLCNVLEICNVFVVIQEKFQEVIEKEVRLKKVIEETSVTDERVAKQLYDMWTALRDALMAVIERRRDSFKHCVDYRKQLVELTARLDVATAAVDAVERSRDSELGDKLSKMEVA